jgi:hypothetical protein
MEVDTDTLLYLLLPPRSPPSSPEPDEDDGGGTQAPVGEKAKQSELKVSEDGGGKDTGQFRPPKPHPLFHINLE